MTFRSHDLNIIRICILDKVIIIQQHPHLNIIFKTEKKNVQIIKIWQICNMHELFQFNSSHDYSSLSVFFYIFLFEQVIEADKNRGNWDLCLQEYSGIYIPLTNLKQLFIAHSIKLGSERNFLIEISHQSFLILLHKG